MTLQDEIRDALDQAAEEAGATIAYKRGADSVSLTVTKGVTEFEQEDDGEIVSRFQSHDWILADPADLVLAAAVTLPRAGDLIEETIGGTVHRYEVMAPLGAQPYRYTDQFRTGLRIHTKKVAEV